MSALAHLTIQTPPDPMSEMPCVTLSRMVVEKIFHASLEYVQDETGEAMVGLVMAQKNGKPHFYLLETIPPRDNTVRQWAMFEQGDEWQGAVFNWWHENWEMIRDWRRKSYGSAVAGKWDVPLQHLGDWHKQPDSMIEPSGGDMRTAKRLMKDLDLPFLLMPIITFEPNTEPLTTSNTLAVATQHQRLRIDFWWVERKGSRFEPVHPLLEAVATLPHLPPIVWWLADEARFDAEVAALEGAGLQVMEISSWSVTGRPPLETCFAIYRPGNRRVWLALTGLAYPQQAPKWRSAPILRPEGNRSLVALLYGVSEPLAGEAIPPWKPEMTLLESIHHIEHWEKGKSGQA